MFRLAQPGQQRNVAAPYGTEIEAFYVATSQSKRSQHHYREKECSKAL
jgi:hypothetical protein